VCLIILFLNTVLFCREHDGCEVIPGRSKLGSTPKLAIANTELTFLTLMTAHAPLSLIQQQFKGAEISKTQLILSFVMPFLVAVCFTFDLKRFPETHMFSAYIIMGTLLAILLDTYWFVLIGLIAAITVVSIKCNRNKRESKEVREKKRFSLIRFFFGGSGGGYGIVNLFFGLGVFLPMLYVMYRNEYYASKS
jgi:hypothetical protein